jgi:catechol 2,3-dioxygenase-like lactoylglutathione lyase family enzyme
MDHAVTTQSRRAGRTLALGILSTLIVLGLMAQAWAKDPLPLRRVLLSTGGVGYFEHEAIVDGDVELPLTVRLGQVDDVLKSLVVYDDRGGVGTISLPGREPLDQVFRELPFRRDALESPVALLRALTGTEIRVTGARALEGQLLGVTAEEVALPNGLGRTTRHRVSVIVPTQGLRQFILEEADQIELVDATLRAQVSGALGALARYRVQDRRTLAVSLKGTGRRTVRVGYVVEAPLWKTAYRLTVPDAPVVPRGAHGLLQGWAVVENMSGQDWEGVELTLASGNPVTFHQALYTAYYVTRPEVPVEVMGRVVPPRVDAGTVREAVRAPAPPQAQARASAPAMARGTVGAGIAAPAPERGFEAFAPAPPAVATISEEATTQVVFRVPSGVSLPTGHSMIIPIVSREVPVERLALYDAQASTAYPLAAVRLTNDSGTGLPPGVLTLYERTPHGANAYVGDARLAVLPAGESRLVSFAVDQKVQIVAEPSARETIAGGKLSRGVFQLTVVDRQSTRYRLKGPPQEERAILIEHPRVPEWRLISPPETDVELARDRYRIRATLGKGEEKVVEVTTERPRTTSLQLAGMPVETLVRYSRTGALDEKVRQAFEMLATMRREIDQEERTIAELEASRKTIYAEQERIRANLASVPATADLRQRYLDAMKQQEDSLAALARRAEDARARLKAARDRLADAIARLEL